MNTLRMTAVALLALILFGTGCGDVAPQYDADSLCEQAADHVAACFPDQSGAPDTCDPAAAEAILDLSCEQLVTDGKADSVCNPFLWWTWAECNQTSYVCGGACTPPDDSPDPVRYHLGGTIDICKEGTCEQAGEPAACAEMVLTDANGEVVAREFTSRFSNAHFSNLDLHDGDYRLSLLDADGHPATMLDPDTGDFVEATQLLTLSAGDIDGLHTFQLAHDQIGDLNRCSTVQAQIASTCDGESMSPEETEWGWVVELEGQTVDGERVSRTRAAAIGGANPFEFTFLHPGSYTVRFHGVDVPQEYRRESPDYIYIVREFSTHNVWEAEFEVELSDRQHVLSMGEYRVDWCD